MITNWFSIAAGVCFVAATLYAFYAGQDLRIVVLYSFLAGANFILGTI